MQIQAAAKVILAKKFVTSRAEAPTDPDRQRWTGGKSGCAA
jgi:hypothetical protein